METITVYLSAEKEGNTNKANEINTEQLRRVLANHGFRDVTPTIGCYEGRKENSFAVVCDVTRLDNLRAIASMFRQACIAYEHNGYGYLSDCDRDYVPDHCLGRRKVSDTYPGIGYDYTFFPDTNTYVRYL